MTWSGVQTNSEVHAYAKCIKSSASYVLRMLTSQDHPCKGCWCKTSHLHHSNTPQSHAFLPGPNDLRSLVPRSFTLGPGTRLMSQLRVQIICRVHLFPLCREQGFVGESSESARQQATVPLSTLKCRPTS